MNKTEKILITISVLALAGYVGYLFYNKSTKEQFDKLIKIANDKKSDAFSGINSDKYNKYLANFKKYFSKKNADNLINIISKKESSWSNEEKKLVLDMFQKLNK